MKKDFRIINLIGITLLFILIGCTNTTDPRNDSGNNSQTTNPTISFASGWWKFTTTAQNVTSNTYIEYDINQNITRAGSDTQEYTENYLDTVKNNLSFNTLKDSVGTYTTFETVADGNLPNWAQITVEQNLINSFANNLISLNTVLTTDNKYKIVFISYQETMTVGDNEVWRGRITIEYSYFDYDIGNWIDNITFANISANDGAFYLSGTSLGGSYSNKQINVSGTTISIPESSFFSSKFINNLVFYKLL